MHSANATRSAITLGLASLLFCSGCFTFIGLGIGAFTDRTETMPKGTIPVAEQCRDVRLQYTAPDGKTESVDATLLSADKNVFRLQLEYGPVVTSDWSNVTKISCKHGNYAILGMVVGAVADVLVVVAVASAIRDMGPLG